MVVVGLVVSLLILMTVSGLLSRILINVLKAAAVVTLTAWIVILVLGFLFVYGVPIYAVIKGKDLATVYRDIEQGRW